MNAVDFCVCSQLMFRYPFCNLKGWLDSIQKACKKFVSHEEVRRLPAINVLVIGLQVFVISMKSRAVVEWDFRMVP